MATDGNDVFPIPFAKFAEEHLAKTPDAVWILLMKQRHGGENHTEAEWRAILDDYRHRPAR